MMLRSLTLAGLTLGMGYSTISQAAVTTCGEPSNISSAAAHLWKNCADNRWNLNVSGGENDKLLTFSGKVSAESPATLIRGARVGLLEPNDNLDATNPSNIRFQFNVAGDGRDGIVFAFADDNGVCVDVELPNGSQLVVGPNRTPVSPPVNLKTMGPCGADSAGNTNCDAPSYDLNSERALFLWKDCEGMWRMRATSGGIATPKTFDGTIVATRAMNGVWPYYLESNDTLSTSTPGKISVSMIVNESGQDGVNFSLKGDSTACVDMGGPVYVGSNRTRVQSPFDINSLQSCNGGPVDTVDTLDQGDATDPVDPLNPPVVASGHAYLWDADTTDSQDFVGTSNVDERPFPRLSTGPIKVYGPAQMFSKYDVFPVKGFSLDWLAKVQAINPDATGLRIFCPQEYQGYGDAADCRLGNGMPFDGTAASTEGCDVYAGHWLYAPGSPLRTAIGADSTTFEVADASRFTPGRFIVIYRGGAGAFNSPEHAKVTAVNTSNNTLTVSRRGFKSTARSHPVGAIVAEHVVGNGDNQEPENWAYNLSTASPLDASGRKLNQVMATWLANHYNKDQFGNPSDAKVEGILFDSDFHFIEDSGHGKRPDVNNDLVLDHGLSSSGENLWGKGLDEFYAMVRQRLPDAVMVGGVLESRGYDAINGTQLEGWPQRNVGATAPDYREIDGRLSAYSLNMHHRSEGPRYTEGINRMPTKLYYGDHNPAADNRPFRFSFGLMLLDDGYYGVENSLALNPWWDEYAVDVNRDSAGFGRALASNPGDESLIRQNKGWMGFPLGPRYRLYDASKFELADDLMVDGTFDDSMGNWTGKNVSVSRVTGASSSMDGAGALKISRHSSYAAREDGAAAWGPAVTLEQGQQYTLVFSTKASEARTVQMTLAEVDEQFHIPAKWSRRVMTFTAPRNGEYRLKFNVGREDTAVWLDSVRLFKGNANVFRRDFDNAVVIVNATPSARTVNLGGSFQRIKGTGQDPINNGATVTQVTVAAYDSAILIRP